MKKFCAIVNLLWTSTCICAPVAGVLMLIHSFTLYTEETPVIAVCFTPGMACTDKIVSAIDDSKQYVYVQAYSFTSKPIEQALERANIRGEQVRVLLDKSQLKARDSVLPALRTAGIKVHIDDKVAIAHNKVIIIDNDQVITGSFNFTKAAQERNAENVVFIKAKDIANAYTENWLSRQSVSQ